MYICVNECRCVCVYVHESEGVQGKCINNSTTPRTTHIFQRKEREIYTKYESITVCELVNVCVCVTVA